jgi:adenylate cyclase
MIVNASARTMAVDKMKRKLTTIFCADVQSYSALMAGDEAETLARLRRYRSIMGDLFERHEGRKVNTWGDAVIAEFASVVEAVRCAVEIQDAVGTENLNLPENKQMWFRIGINLGDVMQDGSDLYGDGVNVAARLESLADPGGIMVSETVFNLTNRHLAIGYDFAGEKKVKEQDEPIAAYRVRMLDRQVEAHAAGAEAAKPAFAGMGRVASAPVTPGPATRSRARFRRWGSWFGRQTPRAVRASIFMILMFAMINLLTNGFSQIWFVYPSIPFAFFLAVRGLSNRA